MKAPGAAAGRHELQMGLPLAVGFVVAAIAIVGAGRNAELGLRVGNLTLLVAALIATVASVRRTWNSPRDSWAWRWLTLCGLLAVVGYALVSAGISEPASWLLALSYSTFAVGIGARLHDRERVPPVESWLETALVVGAAVSLALHFQSPTSVGSSPLTLPLPALVSSVALLSALAFGLLRGMDGRGGANRSLAIAALSLGIAALPFSFKGIACCNGSVALSLGAVAAWLLLSSAALQPDASLVLRRGWHNRQMMVPAAGLLMALILVHAAIHPPLRTPTLLAVSSLALLLAVRVAHLLHTTHSQTDAQHQLAQSHALIEIGSALAGVTDLESTFATVTRLTCNSLNAHGAGILILVDGGQAIELQSSAGLPAANGKRCFPLEGSFAGRIIASGEPRGLISPKYESAVSAQELDLTGHAPFAMAPLNCRGDAMGALCCVRSTVFSPAELELLGALADQAALAIQNAQLFEQVHALSLTDPLTGLSNRRQLDRDLGREFAAARRGRPLVAVMFDLNRFKDYNDRFGHLAGDQVLRALGEALAAETRAMNPAGRYGGDEFVALLTDTDALGAQILVQRVRERFGGAMANLGFGDLTVSAGIAEYTAEMTNPAHLLAAADLALYASKGRRPKT
ncbi:MAG: sensor domain-containing diguanylate cyclase [Longimicrobiales bacterium]